MARRQSNRRPGREYQEQHEANVQIKAEDRVAAARYIDRQAAKHEWTAEELADVKGALGV